MPLGKLLHPDVHESLKPMHVAAADGASAAYNEATVGVLLACVGNIMINLGMNLIKLGNDDKESKDGNQKLGTADLEDQDREGEDKDNGKKKKNAVTGSKYALLIGWILFVTGNGFNFTALSMAPQTLLASLGSVQFIANLVFLGCYLGDTISLKNVFGTVLVITGNTVLIFGYKPTTSGFMDISELYNYYVSHDYKLYTTGTIVFYILFTIVDRIQLGSQCQTRWLGKLTNLIPQESTQYQPLKESPPTGPAPPTSPPPGATDLSAISSRTGSPASSGDDSAISAGRLVASPPRPALPSLEFPEGPRSRSKARSSKDEGLESPASSKSTHRRRHSVGSGQSGQPQSTTTTTHGDFQTPTKGSSTFTPSQSAMKRSIMSGILFSAASAMLGSQSLITGKSMAVFIRHSSQGTVEFLHPFNLFNVTFFFSVVVAWAISAAFWLYRLSISLLMYDAMFIIPVNQTMWIIFSVASGGVFYQEFRALQPKQWAMLGTGLLLVIGGVVFLVPNDKKEEKRGEDCSIQMSTPSAVSDIEEQQKLLSRSTDSLVKAEEDNL